MRYLNVNKTIIIMNVIKKFNVFTAIIKHNFIPIRSLSNGLPCLIIRESLLVKQSNQIKIFDGVTPGITLGTNICIRNYAKSKDIKKSKGKKIVDINPDDLAKMIDMESYKKQLQTLVDNMKEDFIKNLSLRSTTGSIETLEVHLDGKKHTLQELAQIIRKNPKTIVLNMSTFPQAIPVALKAINESGMNLNPQQDGTTIYLPVPKVTKEHRENLAKNAKALFVKYREAMKSVQNKNIGRVKKLTNVSSDLTHNLQIYLEQTTQTYVNEAERILETKRTELIGK